jgi:cbb3-type cytochrome oxidase cytochrome c subunit
LDFKKRHANNAKAQMADDNSDEDDALFTLKDEQADSDKDAIIAYLKALIKNFE